MPMLCSWVPLVMLMAAWFAAAVVELWRAASRGCCEHAHRGTDDWKPAGDVMVWQEERPARLLVSSTSHRIDHCAPVAGSRAVEARTSGAERALRKT